MFKKFFSMTLAAMFILGISSVSFAAAFEDVPQGHWAYKSVMKLVNDRVITPDGSAKFNGNNNATRYDLAIMLTGLFDKIAPEKISGSSPFSDVSQNDPACHAVVTMKALEVMEGYGDGTFRGDVEIKREELALTLYTFLKTGGINFDGASSSYSDLPEGHWAYPAVSGVTSAGLMDGYGDGTFKGGNKITKFELASIMATVDEKYFS